MSEAPDVEKQSLHWDKDGQNTLHGNTDLSLRHQIPFHPKKHSGVTLVCTWFVQIHPAASLIALLSFK